MEQGGQHTRVEVHDRSIAPAALIGEAGAAAAGAVVVFLGTARDHSPGKQGVTHLEYEAYREQVEPKILEMVAEARDRWDLVHVVVEHRVGTVSVGEPSVAVVVSAAHREPAFDAARFLIDTLKERAPIWKKEHWAGGAEWVRGA